MRLIASLSGTLAIVVSSDDVTPPSGVMALELIEFIATLYNFSVKPIIPDGVAPSSIPVRAFASEFFVKDDVKIPIFQLGMFPNGYVVTAATTDGADMIMSDLFDKLDNSLGFRNKKARQQRIYQSNLSVQFAPALEQLIAQFALIAELLNKKISRPELPFTIKRLAFGSGDVVDPNAPMTIDTLKTSDFTIERRALEPYPDNRYFCSAPARTSDHIKILEEIEKRLR